MQRLGILGGTFNPPHRGHIAAARHAYRELGLDRVLLIPVNTPPHKALEDDPGSEHRLEMTRLAVAGDEHLLAWGLEIERGGPSYTVDTLRELHTRYPGADLIFVAGGDIAKTLPEWRQPREVLKLARLAVAEREGSAREQIRSVLAPLGGADRVTFLEMPTFDVSSSMVRERAAHGERLRDLVPGAVAEYIRDHRLYRPGVPPLPPPAARARVAPNGAGAALPGSDARAGERGEAVAP